MCRVCRRRGPRLGCCRSPPTRGMTPQCAPQSRRSGTACRCWPPTWPTTPPPSRGSCSSPGPPRRAHTTGADKTSIVAFQPEDHPGGLLELLEQFAVCGVNLVRIESRPTGDALGRYCFAIDAEGHIAEARMAEAPHGLAPVLLPGQVPRVVPERGSPAHRRAPRHRRRGLRGTRGPGSTRYARAASDTRAGIPRQCSRGWCWFCLRACHGTSTCSGISSPNPGASDGIR